MLPLRRRRPTKWPAERRQSDRCHLRDVNALPFMSVRAGVSNGHRAPVSCEKLVPFVSAPSQRTRSCDVQCDKEPSSQTCYRRRRNRRGKLKGPDGIGDDPWKGSVPIAEAQYQLIGFCGPCFSNMESNRPEAERGGATTDHH